MGRISCASACRARGGVVVSEQRDIDLHLVREVADEIDMTIRVTEENGEIVLTDRSGRVRETYVCPQEAITGLRASWSPS